MNNLGTNKAFVPSLSGCFQHMAVRLHSRKDCNRAIFVYTYMTTRQIFGKKLAMIFVRTEASFQANNQLSGSPVFALCNTSQT